MVDIGQKITRIIKLAIYMMVRLISRALCRIKKGLRILDTENKARVLVYHRVCSMPREKWIEYHNVLPSSFEEQMRLLNDKGYNVITLSELCQKLLRGIEFPPRTIVLTFDDGYANVYHVAYPIMRRYGFKPTVFIVSDYVGANTPFKWLRWDSRADSHKNIDELCWKPLNKEELVALAEEGAIIGSHGESHKEIIWPQNAQILKTELANSKRILKDIIGCDIDHYNYPFGLTGEKFKKVEEVASVVREAGYVSACTGRIGAIKHGSNIYTLNRIPVYEQDTIKDFEAKVSGGYDWLCRLQRIWHMPFYGKAFQKQDQDVEKAEEIPA